MQKTGSKNINPFSNGSPKRNPSFLKDGWLIWVKRLIMRGADTDSRVGGGNTYEPIFYLFKCPPFIVGIVEASHGMFLRLMYWLSNVGIFRG